MILAENIHKAFTLSTKERKRRQAQDLRTQALQGVDLQALPGRITALLGPNGAGKTTLLRLIATMLQADKGCIKVMGLDTRTHAQEIRRRIGFLTGTTGLYDRLTPHELLQYFANLNRIDKQTFQQREAELVARLHMGDFLHKRIAKLSVGMRQKVSIARTLIHDPDVLIFDEPTTGLDIITSRDLVQLIREAKAQGKTILFSSHIMQDVDLLCDDLFMLYEGQVILQSSMESFRAQAQGNLTEAFIQHIESYNTSL